MKTTQPKSKDAREKERARQLRKYHANKDRDRDVARAFEYFWARRGRLPTEGCSTGLQSGDENNRAN